jgi:hypothetical protein
MQSLCSQVWNRKQRLAQYALAQTHKPTDLFSFVSRVRATSGFAAGCEAVALPRRRCTFYFLGYALGYGLWPNRT